jgi:hypothetical protein
VVDAFVEHIRPRTDRKISDKRIAKFSRSAGDLLSYRDCTPGQLLAMMSWVFDDHHSKLPFQPYHQFPGRRYPVPVERKITRLAQIDRDFEKITEAMRIEAIGKSSPRPRRSCRGAETPTPRRGLECVKRLHTNTETPAPVVAAASCPTSRRSRRSNTRPEDDPYRRAVIAEAERRDEEERVAAQAYWEGREQTLAEDRRNREAVFGPDPEGHGFEKAKEISRRNRAIAEMERTGQPIGLPEGAIA